MSYANFVLREGISNLKIIDNKLVVTGNGNNVYWYDLSGCNSLIRLMKTCQSNPTILSFDGKIRAMDFPKSKKGVQGLLTSTAGTIWYVDWEERVTIKLTTWHNGLKNIQSMVYSREKDRLITSATDFSVKVWKCQDSFEEDVDFYIINKVCMCLDSSQNCLVGGFSDGTVR